MLRTVDYIDLLRDRTETGSDYAVAKLLGVSEDAVNQYRKGTRAMSADVALLVAEKLQVPLLEVLTDTHAEHAKTPEMRKKWAEARKLWAQVVKIVLVAICAAPWMHGLPIGDGTTEDSTSYSDSESTQPTSDGDRQLTGITIMRHPRRALLRIARWLTETVRSVTPPLALTTPSGV